MAGHYTALTRHACIRRMRALMANTKSAEKRARQAQERRALNVTQRSKVRSAVRKVVELRSSAGNKAEAAAALKDATPVIDAMARKGIIHPQQGRPAQEPPRPPDQGAGRKEGTLPIAKKAGPWPDFLYPEYPLSSLPRPDAAPGAS